MRGGMRFHILVLFLGIGAQLMALPRQLINELEGIADNRLPQMESLFRLSELLSTVESENIVWAGNKVSVLSVLNKLYDEQLKRAPLKELEREELGRALSGPLTKRVSVPSVMTLDFHKESCLRYLHSDLGLQQCERFLAESLETAGPNFEGAVQIYRALEVAHFIKSLGFRSATLTGGFLGRLTQVESLLETKSGNLKKSLERIGQSSKEIELIETPAPLGCKYWENVISLSSKQLLFECSGGFAITDLDGKLVTSFSSKRGISPVLALSDGSLVVGDRSSGTISRFRVNAEKHLHAIWTYPFGKQPPYNYFMQRPAMVEDGTVLLALDQSLVFIRDGKEVYSRIPFKNSATSIVGFVHKPIALSGNRFAVLVSHKSLDWDSPQAGSRNQTLLYWIKDGVVESVVKTQKNVLSFTMGNEDELLVLGEDDNNTSRSLSVFKNGALRRVVSRAGIETDLGLSFHLGEVAFIRWDKYFVTVGEKGEVSAEVPLAGFRGHSRVVDTIRSLGEGGYVVGGSGAVFWIDRGKLRFVTRGLEGLKVVSLATNQERVFVLMKDGKCYSLFNVVDLERQWSAYWNERW